MTEKRRGSHVAWLGVLAALPACALPMLQKGPIKSTPARADAAEAKAAGVLRQARDKALAEPASAEAAGGYTAAAAEAIGAGLKRDAQDWDWDKIIEDALGGVERNCAAGPRDVCTEALMHEARLLWASKRPGEAVRAARRSMELGPTLAAGGLLIQMYDQRNEHGPVAGVCEKMKDLIRAEPRDKRLAWLRLCYEQARAGSLEQALAWLTPDEMKEAKDFIGGEEETDRYRGMIGRAREESDKVRSRAFDLDRHWNLVIKARCPQRMYLAGELNPFAEGKHLQPLDKGDAVVPVSMGAVIWIFDANKKAINVRVVDEQSSRIEVDCHSFILR